MTMSDFSFAPPTQGAAARPNATAVWSARLVALTVVCTTSIAMLVALTIASSLMSMLPSGSSLELSVDQLTLSVNTAIPSLRLMWFALAVVVLVALIAIALELGASLLTLQPRYRRLERLRDLEQSSMPAQPGLTVVIPAHNEELLLAGTLLSLRDQTQSPTNVVVVADNCSDRTVQVAHDCEVEVFVTEGNMDRKAGALNQFFRKWLVSSRRTELVLVMDADTRLEANFLETACREFSAINELSAAGALFLGAEGGGILGQLQRNEFERYAGEVARRRGRVFVLTGTATVFRSTALLDVAAARGTVIPGRPGSVYDVEALTEDNELTLALKSLGAHMRSPRECRVITEIMPTVTTLWNQRKRWQRGALENLGEYGFTLATLRYWGQQFGIGYGVAALWSFMAFFLLSFLVEALQVLYVFWILLALLFAIERTWTVWSGGWRARLLAAPLIPEIIYAMWLQCVFIASVSELALGRQATWSGTHHTDGGVL